MSRSSMISALVCALLACTVAAAQSPQSEQDDIAFMAAASSVHAAGGPGRYPGTYAVELEYHPADPTIAHKALLVVAKPSETLLLAVWNGELGGPDFDEAEYRDFVAARSPLASTVGALGASHPRVHVEYDPAGDTHVEVRTLDRQMDERIVSAPSMAADGSFAATTFFEEGSSLTEGGRYKHCCDCGEPPENCGTMCIYCWTPEFECICVPPVCEIFCGWQ